MTTDITFYGRSSKFTFLLIIVMILFGKPVTVNAQEINYIKEKSYTLLPAAKTSDNQNKFTRIEYMTENQRQYASPFVNTNIVDASRQHTNDEFTKPNLVPGQSADAKVMGPPDSSDVSEEPSAEADHLDHMIKFNRDMEIAFQILNVADTVETVYALSTHRFVELNPIIGRHPSSGKVIVTKAINGAFHYFLYRTFKDNVRSTRLFEYFSVAVQGGVVIYNATVLF